MEGPIDMEQKVFESRGCSTHYVTLTFKLTHGGPIDVWSVLWSLGLGVL